jgi:transposase-like protein
MITLPQLLDNAKCFETVRTLRWPDKVSCPHCSSEDIIKQGKDDTQPERQRYSCKACRRKFDDLTDTIFAGHHQPLKIWVLCLYFMGLNLSNAQIARELDLNEADVQQMTQQLRSGIASKKKGSRYFCESLFWASQPKQAAKITRPLLPAAPQPSCGLRLNPTRG